MLDPLTLFPRSRTPPPDNALEKGDRTRLVFWPHAGPISRRGSQLDYEVSRCSNDSLAAPTAAAGHNVSMDSLNEVDVSIHSNSKCFAVKLNEERSKNIRKWFPYSRQ